MAVTATRTDRVNLLDYDREGLRDYFVSIGEKPFRADQVIKWLYQHGVSEFSEMSNLAVSCLLYTSPSPRDLSTSRMPSSA